MVVLRARFSASFRLGSTPYREAFGCSGRFSFWLEADFARFCSALRQYAASARQSLSHPHLRSRCQPPFLVTHPFRPVTSPFPLLLLLQWAALSHFHHRPLSWLRRAEHRRARTLQECIPHRKSGRDLYSWPSWVRCCTWEPCIRRTPQVPRQAWARSYTSILSRFIQLVNNRYYLRRPNSNPQRSPSF